VCDVKIILMRHGNASQAASDSKRPLSEKGVNEAVTAGIFLRSINQIPDVILHSPLLRSKQTADLVEKELGGNNLLMLHEGLKPEDSPWEFLSQVLREFDEYVGSDYTIMAVGHEPFMSSLASLLLWNSKCDLPFSTGTLLGASSYSPEKAWDLCFYVKAQYLTSFLPSQQ
jgi:phosphohistidine phosphatase